MKKADVFSGKGLFTSVPENPKSIGTNAWHSFNLIQQNEGIRFEDYIAAGGRRLDLKWDTEHKFVLMK